MRENRPYGLEGGEAGSTGLPYPYAPLPTGDWQLNYSFAPSAPSPVQLTMSSSVFS